jgi:hypothetical protein
MTADHLDTPSPTQFAGWTLPIPNLPGSVFRQETSVLNLSSNAFLHQKIYRFAVSFMLLDDASGISSLMS